MALLTRGRIPIEQHPHAVAVAEGWRPGYMHGQAGVGKTFEAICRGISLGKDTYGAYTCRFVTAADLIEAHRILGPGLKEATDQEALNARKIIDAANHAQHLIIDDVGARRPTDYAIDILDEIVDRRNPHTHSTLVTSNLTPELLRSRWGDRIASRILGFGEVEEMVGRDRRVEL